MKQNGIVALTRINAFDEKDKPIRFAVYDTDYVVETYEVVYYNTDYYRKWNCKIGKVRRKKSSNKGLSITLVPYTF